MIALLLAVKKDLPSTLRKETAVITQNIICQTLFCFVMFWKLRSSNSSEITPQKLRKFSSLLLQLLSLKNTTKQSKIWQNIFTKWLQFLFLKNLANIFCHPVYKTVPSHSAFWQLGMPHCFLPFLPCLLVAFISMCLKSTVFLTSKSLSWKSTATSIYSCKFF